MNTEVYSSFAKHALLERLVRLGATDIPKTPRLFMRQRSPEELHALQESVSAFGHKVTQPVVGALEPALNKLPGRIQPTVRKGAHMIARDPLGLVAWGALPVPGSLEAYYGGKKALEKSIDRVFPIKGK